MIRAYHQLWQIEKRFRMSKPDPTTHPIYHRQRDSIETHPTIIFAAVAAAHHLETVTSTTIHQLVGTLRRYRTIDIQAGNHIITTENPIPPNTTA